MRRTTLALLLAAAGCASEQGSGGAAVFTDSAGVAVAQSSYARPAWSRNETWHLSPTPRIQVGNRIEPNQQLYQVRHAQRLPDGGIVVANTGLSDVRVFDERGTHVRTLAMPVVQGDTVKPAQVHPLPGDSILVIGTDLSLTVFGPEGRMARRAAIAEPEEGVPDTARPVGMFADGTVLIRVDLPDDPEATGTGRRKIRLLHYSREGRLIGPYGDFEDQALLFADRGAWIFGPSAQHAIADSTIWYGTAENFEIREIAPDGRTLTIFRLDRPGSPVLQTDRGAYRMAAARQVAGTDRASRMDSTLELSVYADTFPAYDRLFVADDGSVWARSYQWFDLGSGHAWTVFGPEGRFLGTVRTPSTLEIFQIGSDFLLGRLHNARGREAVYVYGLVKPGEAPGDGGGGGGGQDP